MLQNMWKKWFFFLLCCAASCLLAQDTNGQQVSPRTQQLPTDEIPPLPSSEQMTKEYEGSFIRVLASIVGVILLIVATFWILKRLGRGNFGKSGANKTIQILERRPLSPKTVLFLVQIDNKRVLLSESQLEVRGLASVEELESEERR